MQDLSDSCGAPQMVSLSLFVDDEGGYTSVAFAIALLLSFTMVFSLAAAAWTLSRSADVQSVADAAALSATSVVGSYSTVVQTLDACVQTLGIAGMLMTGAGMIALAVPGATAAGEASVKGGLDLLRTRKHLVESASAGMERIEAALPLLIMAESASAIEAASTGQIGYTGLAVPYPLASHSDFSQVGKEVDDEGIEDATGQLSDASQKSSQAKADADAAKEEAWRADCVDDPSCLRSRASQLADLADPLNPTYPSPEVWTFGAPLARARSYYAARLAKEAPEGEGIEEVRKSAIREAFYAYAEQEMQEGSYEEMPDGTVEIDLRALPHNAEETKGSGLYQKSIWPVSIEGTGKVLHASLSCPGAQGASAGTASLADLDAGTVQECPVCQMNLKEMGRVASATTNTSSGFEHYWRIIQEASERYRKARQEEKEADAETREVAEDNASRFDEAMEVLKAAQPEFCPPGAWGCVALVSRPDETGVPLTQMGSFLPAAALPSGIAISAAVLAPDESADGNTVLSRFVDGWEEKLGEGDSLVGSALDVWSSLLESYGAGYAAVEDMTDTLFGGVGNVFGGSAAAWLREHLHAAVEATGMEPCDLRPRKPVLTGSRNVFVQAGLVADDEREHLLSLLDEGDVTPDRLAEALGLAADALPEDGAFKIAELVVPGTSRRVPLEFDVGALL